MDAGEDVWYQKRGGALDKEASYAGDCKSTSSIDRPKKTPVKKTIPRIRQNALSWTGWGFKDSRIHRSENGYLYTKPENRYEMLSGKTLPSLDIVAKLFSMDSFPDERTTDFSEPKNYPQPAVQKDFLNCIRETKILHSFDGMDRLYRAHGQLTDELIALRNSTFFKRIPDLVVWPSSHEDVEKIARAAFEHNVVLIPYGGGTGLTRALLLSEEEDRMIVSLDLSEMCHILWVDEEDLTVRVEAGIVGQDLEKELRNRNFTVGHEPDSIEFSTVGGWVATRASGKKTSKYGNIEDLVKSVRAVTAIGTVEKDCSCDKTINDESVFDCFLGSEGTLGVITEVTLKIQPIPKVKHHESLVFEDYQTGISFLRDVACNKCQPAFIRLLDNKQYKAAAILKPGGFNAKLMEKFERAYLSKVRGFDLNRICVATILFEGDPDEVEYQQKAVYGIAHKYGAQEGGESHGERGYKAPLLVCYVRDTLLDNGFITRSFEVSCPWDKIIQLLSNIEERFKRESKDFNINNFMITSRVSQPTEAGANLYITLNWYDPKIEDAIGFYKLIENAVREEAIKGGASVSFRHGIGKEKNKYLRDGFSRTDIKKLRNLKHMYDPTNTFATNFLDNL